MNKQLQLILAIIFLLIAYIISNQFYKTSDPVNTQVLPVPETQLWKLRFGHNSPVDSALHQAALKFSESVKEKTQGKVIVDVYPSQQLGNDH